MKTRQIALAGVLVALAMVLSYVERLIPIPLPVPGLKLGLPNLVTLYALYTRGFWPAISITIVRCVLVSLLFASPTQLAFSLLGGIFALCVMAVCQKSRYLSVFGVSVSGAAAHHIGQVCAAVVVLSTTGVFTYLTFLLPASIPTGLLIAYVYLGISKSLTKSIEKGG